MYCLKLDVHPKRQQITLKSLFSRWWKKITYSLRKVWERKRRRMRRGRRRKRRKKNKAVPIIQKSWPLSLLRRQWFCVWLHCKSQSRKLYHCLPPPVVHRDSPLWLYRSLDPAISKIILPLLATLIAFRKSIKITFSLTNYTTLDWQQPGLPFPPTIICSWSLEGNHFLLLTEHIDFLTSWKQSRSFWFFGKMPWEKEFK